MLLSGLTGGVARQRVLDELMGHAKCSALESIDRKLKVKKLSFRSAFENRERTEGLKTIVFGNASSFAFIDQNCGRAVLWQVKSPEPRRGRA